MSNVATNMIGAARVELLLGELRLPSVKLIWARLAEQTDKEGWPAARFLAALAEHEVADRTRRRIERHLAEARLPAGKTLDAFDFQSVPMISKAQVMALASGDAWLEKGANILIFWPPGAGKSHLSAALGLALIENGWRVLFARTTDLVQRLQVAWRELTRETPSPSSTAMGATHFLMKRLPNVAAEMALRMLAYNLTRVVNIFGGPALVAAIRAG
jgi:DNA replication protein DnaC